MVTTIGLLLVVAIIALVLYFVPGIDATLRKILIAVAVILFVVWVVLLAIRLLGRADVETGGRGRIVVTD